MSDDPRTPADQPRTTPTPVRETPVDRPVGRATPPDASLVEERIARLTSQALVTRRGYLQILGVLSGGLAAGTVAVALGAFRRPTQGATKRLVITEDASQIPVGGSVRFLYPGERHPAMLLRLDEGTFVAYSAVCTHLQCEVIPRLEHDDLYCPCHEGHFDPRSGEPTAGPPERALPVIRLAFEGDAIVAVGEGPVEAADGGDEDQEGS